MKRIPTSAVPYQRTRHYSESTIPAGLLRRHTTKRGVWGRIHVLEGSLLYRILEPSPEEHVLTPEHPGVVSPETPHEVQPVGPIRFFVEFLRRPIQADGER